MVRRGNMTAAPAALAALAFALVGCGGGGTPESGTPNSTGAATASAGTTASTAEELVVGLTYIPDIQFAPWYVAEARGYFADEGLNVKLQHHGSSESLFGAIVAGDEDVIVAGADEMLQARAAGNPLVTFGVVYQEYPVVVIVHEDSEIQTVADLAGQRVGLPGPYGENWFALLALMKQADLTEADLTIEYIGYTQQASMVAGDVDAVVGFVNNDLVTFGVAGIPVRALPTETLPLVGISLGTTDEVLAAREQDLAAFNRAVARALADIIADPEAAVALAFETVDELAISGNREMALTILKATIPLYGQGDLAVAADRWPPMYEFLVAKELAEPGLDPSHAVVSHLAG